MSSTEKQIFSLSVNELRENFRKGSMSFCEETAYGRRKLLDETVLQDKIRSLLFYDQDSNPYVQIENVLKFYRWTDRPETIYGLDGNNRIRCLFLLLDSHPEYSFKPIRYEVEEVSSVAEILDKQDVLNDSANEHSILDRASAILKLKTYFEDLYKESSLNKKQSAAKVLEEIQKRIRKADRATISNSVRLLSLPEEVLESIEQDAIAPSIAVEISRLFDKLTKADETKSASDIWQGFFAFCSQESLPFNKSSAVWFLDSCYPGTQSLDKGKELPDSENEDLEEDAQELGTQKDKSSKPPATPISAEEFTDSLSTVLNTFNSLEPEHIQQEDVVGASELVKSGLVALSKVHDILPPTDSLKLLPLIKELLTLVAGDPAYLVTRADQTEKSLTEVLGNFRKFAKNSNALFAKLYSKDPESVINESEEKGEVTPLNLGHSTEWEKKMSFESGKEEKTSPESGVETLIDLGDDVLAEIY